MYARHGGAGLRLVLFEVPASRGASLTQHDGMPMSAAPALPGGMRSLSPVGQHSIAVGPPPQADPVSASTLALAFRSVREECRAVK
jgi:hypothetical protein